MVKFQEADKRLFKDKYVCKRCKGTVKAPSMKVIRGKVSCRKCGCSALRTKRKK